ncbi:transcription initiation factor TFIID subunit D9 isoform 2 [Galdieria sulphuraria]|uniref:Transcription initiation factor TFIID subunit D9 isoform 2 n=1 Tax=Galdieria sulphuraria TaxID=130081 RepID=M2WXE6_GALSU|nr:transcription initiation factor TFIID subunit D9 isoform 2 [Galdieria sulphuraria]EME28715.1 transcription initiation factor TFIID subunit D9 isoform 2 [Galdieria sulphuraria]|eukprot:XP_005705235.1 transcription initiation factor TFIID subunit D9 isoform 2 [Galdieria sulphuraria]
METEPISSQVETDSKVEEFSEQATPTEVREWTETTGKRDSEEEDSDVTSVDDEEDEQVRLWKQREREIFSNLNEDDQERFEYYRQGDLDKNKVKKLVSTVNPALSMMQPDNPFIIAVKGLGKLYAGELVEMAVDIRNERGEQGAVRPVHLREAYRRMQKAGKTPKYRKIFLPS